MKVIYLLEEFGALAVWFH